MLQLPNRETRAGLKTAMFNDSLLTLKNCGFLINSVHAKICGRCLVLVLFKPPTARQQCFTPPLTT